MEVMPRYRADVAWQVGRIMLKFRPIAPKPVAAGSAAAAPAEGPTGGRKRRRPTPALGNRSKRGRKKAVVTLPLMPETPERKEPPAAAAAAAVPAATAAPRPVRPAGSWVTVEEVTDTWHGGGAPEEALLRRALEGDACPGFASDALDRVTWTNAAYRKMVVGTTGEGEVGVGLATKGKVPRGAGVTCFTCRVRVGFACGRKGAVSMAAPCDVWRAAGERLVWRLDVKAALSLGLGS